MCSTRWTVIPQHLSLEPYEVHVFRVDLASMHGARLRELVGSLSADERSRAKRFHFERDRRQYITARGTLRLLLAGYLHSTPAEVRLCYSPHGKPGLVPQDDPQNVQFSLSHAGGYALYAIARCLCVGIDVESIRKEIPWSSLSERFFSRAEAQALRELPAQQQLDAFYTCWVRKEAFVKALEAGLSFPLDQFTVSIQAGHPAFLHLPESVSSPTDWRLYNLDCGPGYAAALVTEKTPHCIEYYELV